MVSEPARKRRANWFYLKSKNCRLWLLQHDNFSNNLSYRFWSLQRFPLRNRGRGPLRDDKERLIYVRLLILKSHEGIEDLLKGLPDRSSPESGDVIILNGRDGGRVSRSQDIKYNSNRDGILITVWNNSSAVLVTLTKFKLRYWSEDRVESQLTSLTHEAFACWRSSFRMWPLWLSHSIPFHYNNPFQPMKKGDFQVPWDNF